VPAGYGAVMSKPTLSDLGIVPGRDSKIVPGMTEGELFAIWTYADVMWHGEISAKIGAASRLKANMNLVPIANQIRTYW